MDDSSLAAELVRDAGGLALSMLRAGLETQYKESITDVVSAADRDAEKLITSRLREDRPDDGLIGEEGARRDGSGRTWYIDPVDGTYNFLCGIPYWCSAVALVDEMGPVVGAVYYPMVDELWVGGRDCPTTLNGVETVMLPPTPLSEVSVATYFHPRHMGDQARVASWQAATSAAATVRMLGSASVDLAGVATGRLGVFLQANLHPWDWHPGAALVLGAGGVADELTVGTNTWQIAGNARSVEDVKAALGSA